MESVTVDRSLFEVRPVIQVRTLPDFHLEMLFSTGETRIFDFRPYLDFPAFRRLKDVGQFQLAYVAFDTVCWPGNLDLAPETLYFKSVPI